MRLSVPVPRTDPRAPEIRAFVVIALPQPKGYSKAYATAWGAHQDGFLTGNLPVSKEDAGLESLQLDAKKRRNEGHDEQLLHWGANCRAKS
jgi:hypothetical protein